MNEVRFGDCNDFYKTLAAYFIHAFKKGSSGWLLNAILLLGAGYVFLISQADVSSFV